MRLTKQALWMCVGCVAGMSNAFAQEHVHGHGSVFIVQQGNEWQIQYTLPAADALGFEHKPETKQQKQALSELYTNAIDIHNLMSFDKKCEQTGQEQNLADFGFDKSAFDKLVLDKTAHASAKHDAHGHHADEDHAHEEKHNEHGQHEHDDKHKEHAHHQEKEHDEHKHHDHHEDGEHEDHHEEHEASHQDVELTYNLKCAKGISQIEFSIFDKMPSLQKLDVQWSINSGQGSITIQTTNPQVKLR